MIKLFCFALVFGLYFACLCTYLSHIHYFNSLFKRVSRFKQNSSKFSGHRSIHTRVAPMYRKEYFGYDYFVLPDINSVILTPHRHFRVYGVIHPFIECLVVYKDDVAKTIICLDDKRYADNVLESLRITYRNTILTIIGGGLWWQVCLPFLTS